MRECWNWQTGQTKDLVVIVIVWVQVPSPAFVLWIESLGFILSKLSFFVRKELHFCWDWMGPAKMY